MALFGILSGSGSFPEDMSCRHWLIFLSIESGEERSKRVSILFKA